MKHLAVSMVVLVALILAFTNLPDIIVVFFAVWGWWLISGQIVKQFQIVRRARWMKDLEAWEERPIGTLTVFQPKGDPRMN